MATCRSWFDRPMMIGYMVTLIGLFILVIPVTGSSIKGEVGHTGGYINSEFFPNITDILSTRDGVETRTWETAMSIFQRLKTSTCGTEAAGRLFGTCKNIGNATSEDTENAYELEQVKMLYAVRMAVCETGAGGSNAPTACREAVSFSSSIDDEKTYVKHDLMISQSLKSCIGSLQKKHSTWTSYSNNLQDATALCNAPRQDVEGRRMVSMYRDMLQGVFGISELLKEQMAATGKWFGQAELRAIELELAHSQILDNLTSQHEEHSARIMQDFETMQHHANIASHVVDRIGADLERLVSGVQKNATSFGADLITMKNNLVVMYTGAYTEMALSMNKQISHVENLKAAISNIINEHSDLMLNLREDIIFVREMWQAYSAQIFADQTMQIEFAQELRNISAETAMHQHEARDGALFVTRHLQDMTDQMTEIEQAFGVVLTMYEAYNHGYLRAAMIELVALAFVFFSVGLSLLIPKMWHCGKIVVFLYGWIQASRALFGYLDLSRRMTEVIFVTHQLLRQSPLIAATIIGVSVLICIIAALRFELGIITKQITLKMKQKEERIALFNHRLELLGGRLESEDMSHGVRAFSSPPGL